MYEQRVIDVVAASMRLCTRDFAPSGTNHDIIAFGQSVFADVAAVLAHATQIGSDVVIEHDATHSVTLNNMTTNLLLHHQNAFEFLA